MYKIEGLLIAFDDVGSIRRSCFQFSLISRQKIDALVIGFTSLGHQRDTRERERSETDTDRHRKKTQTQTDKQTGRRHTATQGTEHMVT